MNSYSLRRSPEKSARAKELANVNESQKSRAPAPPAEKTLDSFASGGAQATTPPKVYPFVRCFASYGIDKAPANNIAR
jgi:hypothetical protein